MKEMSMTTQVNLVPEDVIASFHPDLQASVRAVNTGEVQEILRQLGKYGLGVALPHMHTDEGMVPLPEDMMSSEDNLKVTFRKRNQKINSKALPVMWRRGEDISCVANCSAECGVCC
jgi:hypothetical protein